MMSLSILDGDARPQAASPLFTRLPTELRLMIYSYVFMGCQTTVWFDAEFGDYRSWHWRYHSYKHRLARDGQCCFEHSGGGFGLLMTCHTVYIEGFQVYWSETALRVTRDIRTWRQGCELQQVCARLPAAIKANLGHLQNIKLQVLRSDPPTEDDPNSAPALLRQFPKLVTCAFLGCPPLAKVQEPPYIPGVPDSENVASFYRGLGRFHLKGEESPAAYLERRYGIERSCRVGFLSTFRALSPPRSPSRYERRVSPISMYMLQVE